MPIRINLLNEALAEEDLRRRDPVKRSIYAGAFLVALSLVWFSSTWLEYKLTQQHKSAVDIEIDSHTNEFAQVQSNLKKITDGTHRLDALTQINTNRFLQGTLLNAIQQVYVPNVQLLRIKLDQSFTVTAGTAAKTNNFGVVAGRPASSLQHTVLTLDAKDTSQSPGDQVNRYKDAITKNPYFKAHLDPTNGVKLITLSPPQTAMGSKPFVSFTLECRFIDQLNR
jgi:hypothetical protein